jgi:hypothetical protein
MMRFRVFIGGWCEGDPDWTSLDVGGLPWDEAVRLMAEHLASYKDFEDCDQCRADAREGLERLASSAPGAFEAQVDGDDYLILVEIANVPGAVTGAPAKTPKAEDDATN